MKTNTDYAHAAFLALTCWLHPDRRGVAKSEGGLNLCMECATNMITKEA